MNTTAKSIAACCTGALLLVLPACQSGPTPSEVRLASQRDSLITALDQRDSLIGSMSLSFNEIEKNLDLVDEKELNVNNTSEADLTMDQRERILRDIQLMNGLMNDSRERIADLTKKLDNSKVDAKGLRKKLKDLDLQLAQRDSSLAVLKEELIARDFKIEQVSQQLGTMEMELAKTQAFLQQQTDDLNLAWYVVGERKELQERGVITREGGVLGIGRTSTVNNDISAAAFTEVDQRNTDRIPVNSKEAKLVSEHPAASYELVKENEAVAYVHIKDPASFWRLSRYAVLEVHN